MEQFERLDGIDFVELPVAKEREYFFAIGTRSGKTASICDNFRVKWFWS